MPQYTFERLEAGYLDLWNGMTVTKVTGADSQARRIISAKDRYKTVESTTGVPWFVVGCMHMRESDGNFNTWLHNGDPMKRNGVPVQTVHVPKGRPPNPDCSWEDGAKDALVDVEHLDSITNWGPAHVAYALEKFNGFGYRAPSRNIPSPYLWGGTSVQKRGKFVRDGVYNKNVMDPQIGGMAVLQRLMTLDPEAVFVDRSPPAVEEVQEAPPPVEGKAIDTEDNVKPLTKSKTIWGGIIQWASGMGATAVAFFNKLDNPYTLAAFIVILIAIAIGAFLVIKGRVDVNNVVKHLSDEE